MGACGDLVVGNFDRGIQVRPPVCVANIDCAFGVGDVTGALALKCLQVSPRIAVTAGSRGAVLCYAPFSDEYLDYYERVFGYRPRVYAPSERYTDVDRPLSLVDVVMRDTELLARLREDGQREGWRLAPFISDLSVHALGKAIGLPVGGMREEDVARGNIAALNSKAAFARWCQSSGVDTPGATIVSGYEDLIYATREVAGENRGYAHVRLDLGAGGLGAESLYVGDQDVEQVIRQRLDPLEPWLSQEVLVEPYLDVFSCPSITMRVLLGGLVRVAGCMSQLVKNGAFKGGAMPCRESALILDKMIDVATAFGEEVVVPHGGEDSYNVDFGLLACRSRLVAFEPNVRVTARAHPVATAEALRGSDQVRIVSLDDHKLPAGTTFAEYQAAIDRTGWGWDSRRGIGVVISIPPATIAGKCSAGHVIIADRHRDEEEMVDKMSRLF